jgi:NAD(P)-dependent dehydrogenase (short-subunit alcohol dehydrogenase family)
VYEFRRIEIMNVLITGANGGLGSAVTRRFSDDGATVIGIDRHWHDKMPFATISADLTTAEGCNAMVEQALQHGPIDALVHLVGGFSGGTSIADTSDQVWDLMINTNLRIAFLTIRAVLKPMIAAGSGRIVAIGARAAEEPAPNFAAYAVSKAAILALIKNVAAEGKDLGITANAVLPGTMDTPLNRKAMPNADVSKWVQPADVAKAIACLLGTEVSGAAIPIYGRS